MSLLFQPLLATNYDGLMEGLAWLAALVVAVIGALLALLLSASRRARRASHIYGYGALLFSCLSTLILFFSLYPVNRSKDGYRETLITVSSCTAAVLVARLAAALRASPGQTRSVTPPPADERNT